VDTLSSPLPLLELARAGNLQAIAYWIDRYLIPEGIYTRVEALHTGCLTLAVEFRQVPVGLSPDSVLADRGRGDSLQNRLVQFICHQLWRLDCEAIEGVRIAARFAGQPQILWQRSVRLLAPAAKRRLMQTGNLDPVGPSCPRSETEAETETTDNRLWYSLLLAGAAAPSFALGFAWGYQQLEADPLTWPQVNWRWPELSADWKIPLLDRDTDSISNPQPKTQNWRSRWQPQPRIQGIVRIPDPGSASEIFPHVVQTVGGRQVAYVEYSAPVSGEGIDRDRLVEALHHIRDRADWIVLSWRWQGDLGAYPSDAQVELSRLAIDEGADVVLGLHPETVQGGEIYGDRPIIYASSDVLFDNSRAVDGETAAVKVAVNGDRLRVEWQPIVVRDGKPKKLNGEGRWWMFDRIVARSQFYIPLPLEAVFERPAAEKEYRGPFVRDSFVQLSQRSDESGDPHAEDFPFSSVEPFSRKHYQK